MARIISAVLIVLAALTAVLPNAAARQFKKPVYYNVGSLYQIISADLNGDGYLDLAGADNFAGQVGILLGKGNGTFHQAHYFSAPGAIALAAGDFDGDHELDLAVVEYGGTGNSYLGIFLGDGRGNFRHKATYRLGIESESVVIADFDGDGHPDVAVTNGLGYGKDGKSGSVTVFFGKGDGTFKKPAINVLPGFPVGVAAGDLNGDHHVDLVVAQASSFSVAILTNSGRGKFKLTATYQAGGFPVDVTIAALTSGGRPDLVVASGKAVAVLLGNGDGTFGKAALYSTSQLGTGNVYATVVADFNLDGTPDIAGVFAEGFPVHLGVLLYGKGDGTFKAPLPFQGEQDGSGYSLTMGDFNMDGALDLAVGDFPNGAAAVLLNTQ